MAEGNTVKRPEGYDEATAAWAGKHTCPLRVYADGKNKPCQAWGCAWWVEEKRCCAIVQLARQVAHEQ